MSFESHVDSVSYQTDGATTAFALTGLYFMDGGDIRAALVDNAAGTVTDLVNAVDFTVTGDGRSAQGSLTLAPAKAAGFTLRIWCDTDIVQPEQYIENDGFPAATHERAQDRGRMIDRDLARRIDRCLTLPVGEAERNVTLPGLNDLKNNGIWFDAGGLPIGFLRAADKASAPGKMANFDGSGRPSVSSFTTAQVETALQRIGLGSLPTGTLGAFSTTAALLDAFPASVTLGQNTTFATAGRDSAGDGGAGVFYYDATDTTSADNGGTIRVDLLGRRFKLVSPGYVTPELFGAAGDGTADDAGIFTTMFAAANVIRLGERTYGLGSVTTPVPAGVSIYGTPGKSFFQNLNGSGAGITLQGGNTVDGVGFIGYGSKSDTFLDIGFVLDTGTSHFKLTNLSFDKMSGPCIYGRAVSNVTIEHIKITNSRGGTEYTIVDNVVTSFGSLADINLTANSPTGPTMNNIKIRHVDARCAATAGGVVAKDLCVMVDSGPASDPESDSLYPAWLDVIVDDVTARDYERGFIGIYAEYATDGKLSAGKATVKNCHLQNCKSIAVKFKAIQQGLATGNYIENWETVGGEPNGFYPPQISGAIHFNNGGSWSATNNTLVNPSENTTATNAISAYGLINSFADTAGTQAGMSMTGNKAYGTNEAAYRVEGCSRQVSLGDNDAFDCNGHYSLNANTAGLDTAVVAAAIHGGTYIGATQAAAFTVANPGIFVKNSKGVTITGWVGMRTPANLIFALGTADLTIDGVRGCSAGYNSAGSKIGIAFQDCGDVTLANTTINDMLGDGTVTYALNFSGTLTGTWSIQGNDLIGGNGRTWSGMENLPSSGVIIADNVGHWCASGAWAPGSIAAGGSASTSFTIPGVKAGDFAHVALPNTLNGCTMDPYVSADDTVSIYLFNPSAAAIIAPTGTYGVTVTRQKP
jgi:hypothetical protein